MKKLYTAGLIDSRSFHLRLCQLEILTIKRIRIGWWVCSVSDFIIFSLGIWGFVGSL